MKILITGTAGFIGFNLVKPLAEQGNEITGIDNINDYYDVDLKYARLQETGIQNEAEKWNTPVTSDRFPGYRFIRMNLEDRENLFELFRKERFDEVYHLAAQAGVRYSLVNPYTYIESNIAGFLNILEACRRFDVKHLIYASSSSVYGLNTKMPFGTGDKIDQPVSLYAATKKSNELMAHAYSYLYKLPTTGLRFFTAYGPWGRPDMAYFSFTMNIFQNKPITIFNQGDMYRDFTYIDDIIECFVRLIAFLRKKNREDKNKAEASGAIYIPYKIYNIGNSSPVRLLDFISALEEAIGKKAIKEYAPLQPGDVPRTEADVKELYTDIQFKPSTTVKEGIRRFVRWYREYYQADSGRINQ
jgi:UDP-glucuronate 4-epimerase